MARRVLLALAAVVAATSLTLAQKPVTKTASITATATIQAIDKANRMVTLKDDASGVEDTMVVGPAMKRFDELKVGDKVKATYYESIVLQVRQAGAPAPTSGGANATRGTGASPSATLAAQQTTTVDVVSIDTKLPSITVKTADGRTVTRKVEDRKHLEGVKPGDKIDITYTQAALVSVDPAK
jgi:Cu/Ag efflux protein CusF